MPQGTVYIYIIGIAIKSIGTKAKNTTNLLALANFLSALYCFLNFKKCFSEHFDIGEKKKRKYILGGCDALVCCFSLQRAKEAAGLLRALFFGEKCATCVQFVECAGVR